MWSLNILLIIYVSSSLKYTEAAQDWDYLVFSQCWPATVCKIWMESNSSNTCAFPQIKDAWSIHGIWPSLEGSSGPEFCNQTWRFEPEEVTPIESELEQGWINVQNGTPKDTLWAHEWNKHGTCATAIDPLNSQIKYFSQGLQWLQEYTMTTILSEADIVPSDTKIYSLNDFNKAIQNKLGVVIDINCLEYKGKQYLKELRICFSTSLEITDCKYSENFPNIYNNDYLLGNCISDEIIYL